MKFDKSFLGKPQFDYIRPRDLPVPVFVHGYPEFTEDLAELDDWTYLLPTFSDALVTVDSNFLVHSYFDRPAIITPDGGLYWYKHGRPHRDSGPALIHVDGTMIWCKDGKRHRDDGPALIDGDGVTMRWYKNGFFVKKSE